MEKTLEEKKELAAKVIAALKKEYPDADWITTRRGNF